ncbi:MAG TPA: DUF2065 family protein [Candidatus Kaiserbacteria bacterium]|nr:DUF2065 family protein [Candidatus Kaiserbacteria bacterium]
MDTTLFLAQIMGVYFLVAGAGVLMNPGRIKGAMGEIRQSYILPYFDGVVVLVVGLLVVLTHNIWNGLLTSLVSLIGWIAVLEGVLMLTLPQKTISMMMQKFMGANLGRFMGVVSVVVGLYFIYNGFLL